MFNAWINGIAVRSETSLIKEVEESYNGYNFRILESALSAVNFQMIQVYRHPDMMKNRRIIWTLGNKQIIGINKFGDTFLIKESE